MSEAVEKIVWSGLTRLDLMKADGVPLEGVADPGPPAPKTPPEPTKPVTRPKPPQPTRHELVSSRVQRRVTALIANGAYKTRQQALGDPQLESDIDQWFDTPTGAVSTPDDEEE